MHVMLVTIDYAYHAFLNLMIFIVVFKIIKFIKAVEIYEIVV